GSGRGPAPRPAGPPRTAAVGPGWSYFPLISAPGAGELVDCRAHRANERLIADDTEPLDVVGHDVLRKRERPHVNGIVVSDHRDDHPWTPRFLVVGVLRVGQREQPHRLAREHLVTAHAVALLPVGP